MSTLTKRVERLEQKAAPVGIDDEIIFHLFFGDEDDPAHEEEIITYKRWGYGEVRHEYIPAIRPAGEVPAEAARTADGPAND